MAGLPVPANQNAKPVGLTPIQDELLWALAEGFTPSLISKRVAQGDRKRAQALRRKIYKLRERSDFDELFAYRLQTIAMMELGAATKALARKARSGRVDAIKLLFESTGYYNPRTEVNHSGDIQVTIKGLPRPERTVDESSVVDAQVVEE